MAVGSGAGGAVAFARGSFSIARLRSSSDSRNWRSGLAGGRLRRRARAAPISSRPSRTRACRPRPVSPSERTAGRHASANGPSRVKKRVEIGGGALGGPPAAASARRRAPRGAPSSGRSSSRKPGSCWNCARSSSRRVAEISAVSPASRRSATTSRLLASSSSTTVSESVMKFSITSVLVAEDPQHLARLAQARVRALEHLLEIVGRPARPVPSSLMISRKRSR